MHLLIRRFVDMIITEEFFGKRDFGVSFPESIFFVSSREPLIETEAREELLGIKDLTQDTFQGGTNKTILS